MEKAFTFQLASYAPLLKTAGIPFREDEKCLMTNNLNIKSGWLLYISCRTNDAIIIIKLLLPLIKSSGVDFRLIKNQLQQYRLNAGAYGEQEVGKVITFYPSSDTEAVDLSEKINQFTGEFKGPVVPGALRLGNLTYAEFANVKTGNNQGMVELSVPAKQTIPFTVPKAYQRKAKRKVIIGRYYVLIQLLRTSPKGDIFKAVNLKHFAFNWCLVKQGKPSALDDHFNRDMKDRLLWQKKVLESVHGKVQTPAVLDYFAQEQSSYLVLNYAEGEPLGYLVSQIYQGKRWKGLDMAKKHQILNWYLGILNIVSRIHQEGFVHRDITDGNFLVLEDGNLCVLDFELAYNLKEKMPDPPFVLGTFGYAAPEQLDYAVPHIKEDVYSLGALLCFMLTGLQPVEFIHHQPRRTIQAHLIQLTGDSVLTGLAMECLHEKRSSRPELAELYTTIETVLLKLVP